MKGAHQSPHCQRAPWRNDQPKLLLPLPELPTSAGGGDRLKFSRLLRHMHCRRSGGVKSGRLFSKTPKESQYEDP